MFNIKMGIPEMEAMWYRLLTGHRNGTNSKKDEELYTKWGNALKKLAADPLYPSLHTHEIEPLSRRYGMKPTIDYLMVGAATDEDPDLAMALQLLKCLKTEKGRKAAVEHIRLVAMMEL